MFPQFLFVEFVDEILQFNNIAYCINCSANIYLSKLTTQTETRRSGVWSGVLLLVWFDGIIRNPIFVFFLCGLMVCDSNPKLLTEWSFETISVMIGYAVGIALIFNVRCFHIVTEYYHSFFHISKLITETLTLESPLEGRESNALDQYLFVEYEF